MLAATLLLAPLLAMLPTAAAAPDICTPTGKVDQDNAYTYIDMSYMCKETGNCHEACVMFMKTTQCGAEGYDEVQVTDLQLGVTEQAKKDGQLETHTEGEWTFMFDWGATAIPNQAVTNEWRTALINFLNQGNVFLPSTIYFTEIEKDGGQSYSIQAVNQC